MERVRLLLVSGLVLLALSFPGSALAAGGPAPPEPCVPGSVWEDPASGVKFLCIYDEQYGGPHWVPLSGGQRSSDAFVYGSSAFGCLHETVAISGSSGGGADAIARTYRWPCSTIRDRMVQPAGEIRSRVLIQRYGGSGWSTCRDTGYLYNTTTAYGWLAGIDMGAGADCGSGSYRAFGFGAFFQGGLWRGGSLATPSLWLP